MGWGTRRIRKGRKEQLVNRMWSFSHHSGQYPQKCTQVGVGRWKWGRRNRRQGKGVEQKKKKKRGKKKRELVLPSGGLRSLCEMRWGGQSRSPWTGGVHSTKITSATGPPRVGSLGWGGRIEWALETEHPLSPLEVVPPGQGWGTWTGWCGESSHCRCLCCTCPVDK